MKRLVLIILAFLPSLFTLAYVIGQNNERLRVDPFLEPVVFMTDVGDVKNGPALYTLKFEADDGVTCYVLSNQQFAENIKSFEQLFSLGCVR
jgi:hypothetical protein